MELLDVAQFSYNLQRSSASGQSLFELLMGQQPSTPNSIVVGYSSASPAAFNLTKEWQCQWEIARTFLTRVAKKMKKLVDQGRKPANFQVGDLVLVKLQPTHLKFFRRVHK